MNRRLLQPALALIVALVLLAGIAVFSSRTASDNGDPSSRSAGKLGTLALYTWLQQLGLQTARISGSFDVGGADVLIEYDPSVAFSDDDISALRAFLVHGGDVLLAFGVEGAADSLPLLQAFGMQLASEIGAGTAEPAQPFDVAGRVHSVPTSSGFAFLEAPPLVPLLTQGASVVLGGVAVGAGRLYALGDTQPLSNDGLRSGDAASLVLSLLERARGGRIAFDEYHHGEGTSGTGAAAIFAGPMGAAAALAALLVIAFLALNGRRLGHPLSTGDTATVPSALSYVDAMGRLYSRSRRRGPVAARYAAELKRRAAELTGVDAALDDLSFCAAVEAAGAIDAAPLRATLQHAAALSHGHPDDAALLHLAQEVDQVAASWSHPAGTTAQ